MVSTSTFWRAYDEMEARLTSPVSARMIALAALGPGMHVLDVACGRGEPAIPAAHRVGPGGRVLAFDQDPAVLEIARERALREGVRSLELCVADAQSFAPKAHAFDAATCRWALMYLPAPERALACIHRALQPEGRLIAALWAEPERVPYATLGRAALARVTGVPISIPPGPGVFRFCDEAVIQDTWSRSGFDIEHVEELEVPVVEADDGRGFARWLLGFGGSLTRAVDTLAPDQRAAWEAEVAREAEPFRLGDRVLIGGVTRLVVARARR